MEKIRAALKSFYCAGRGIAFCMRHERHFRFHLVMTAYVMYFASFYDFSGTDYAVLVLTCAAVISMEIINTSIEVVIDKVSPKYNVFAMMGKDLASGAVLFASVGAVAVGIFMFWDISVFIRIWGYFISDLIRPTVFILTLTAAVLFVLTARPRRTGAQKNEAAAAVPRRVFRKLKVIRHSKRKTENKK